jgi:citrate lyase subunit beta/citryl-CoA lyase
MQANGAYAQEASMNRSYLFVPADSERKMKKAAEVAADALILDLEDSVSANARPAARELARDYLANKDNIWVRINPIDTADAAADLGAVMASGPTGIVLPKPRGAADVLQLAAMLDDLERKHGIEAGTTAILPICTERPEAMFTLGTYAGATPRLGAMSWGAEDLSAAVGASSNRGDDGNWLPPYELARSLCLFAAGAAEVPAIDTVFTDFRDTGGLARYAANARRDGFSGMLAIHPAQVDVINRAFVPSAAELERAERIVALFSKNPEAGTLAMDGEMLDRPHLVQAQRILQLARRLAAL